MKVSELREVFAQCLGGLDDEAEVRVLLDCDQSGYYVTVCDEDGNELCGLEPEVED